MREVVRSNGRAGEFWHRDGLLCVQIRNPAFGNIRFTVDPEAFGGRGCINAATRPRHVGDPFGWKRIGFVEFARELKPRMDDQILLFFHRSISEARAFVGLSESQARRSLSLSPRAASQRYVSAAADLVGRVQRFVNSQLVDGQPSLSASLKWRGDNGDQNIGADLLSLYDLLGEMNVSRLLFGPVFSPPDNALLNNTISLVSREIETLCSSLEPRAFDIAILNITMELLDSYLISLNTLTSKSLMLPAFTEPTARAFAQEVYYSLQEARAVAENVFTAALLTGHPPDLTRWISEFRYNDYALRELLEKMRSAHPRTHGTSSDMSVLCRDRFRYPPEVCWWMWHATETEMGAPLARIFDFNSLGVSSALGQRQGPSDEISTAEGPEALVGQQVEVLIIRTPVPPLLGTSLALKVAEVTKSELDEAGYFIALPQEPVNLTNDSGEVLTLSKFRFGSSLPRSPPQAVLDAGFNSTMKTNPYKKVVVDVSAEFSAGASAGAPADFSFIGFGLLGLIEPGQPSIFEIQRYRLVQDFIKEREEAAKAWDVDYAR